jgi:ankyrin repeat protein
VKPLTLAVGGAGPGATIPLLLEAGTGMVLLPTRRNGVSSTPLEFAACRGDVKLLWLLLPLYAGPEHDAVRLLAAFAACQKRQLRALTLLLDAGPVDTAALVSALCEAASNGWAAGVVLLLAHGADARAIGDEHGSTALHYLRGTLAECAAVATLLLGAGAELEARAADGATPLLVACHESSGSAVCALLDRGADATAVDAAVANSLHVLASRRTDTGMIPVADMVLNLVAAGADVDARNSDGATPLRVTRRRRASPRWCRRCCKPARTRR